MCCKKASLYGLLLFARSFSPTGITLQTENQDVVSLVMELLRELFRIVPAFKTARRSDGHRTNILTLDDPNSAKIIYESFGYDQRTVALRINRANIENECCSASFLRGVFLSCGSIVDPGKDYHLEFASPHMQLAKDLMAYLSELDFHPKMVGRQGGSVIYFKESEQIEDMLTIMGAVRQSLELMNVKVYKDLRNKVNRVTNCETANIGKTVAASSEQVEAIKKIL
ncbi:MAG TPA: DNA-binding protein WhiA, partial [Clostridia bacterium]|nr:DNA-binding protein WhiA [Clostridia bacterium]